MEVSSGRFPTPLFAVLGEERGLAVAQLYLWGQKY